MAQVRAGELTFVHLKSVWQTPVATMRTMSSSGRISLRVMRRSRKGPPGSETTKASVKSSSDRPPVIVVIFNLDSCYKATKYGISCAGLFTLEFTWKCGVRQRTFLSNVGSEEFERPSFRIHCIAFPVALLERKLIDLRPTIVS